MSSKQLLCHIHGHSHFSNLSGPDALSGPTALVKRAADLGLDSMCLTDHASVSGLPTFYEACSKAGLKAIVGCELYALPEAELDRRPAKGEKLRNYVHVLALCRSWEGLIELFDLLTTAGDAKHYYYRPRNTFEELLSTKHLVFTSACMGGLLVRDDWEHWGDVFAQELGAERFWLEIQAHDHDQQRMINLRALTLRDRHKLNIVAAQDFHYAAPGSHVAHECLINIGKTTIADPNRRTYGTDRLFVTSAAEMAQDFMKGQIAPGTLSQSDVIDAIKNTRRLADQLDFKWQGLSMSLPKMSSQPERKLMELCIEGLKRKGKTSQEYVERLKYEFKVIQQSGFLNYFLVLHDIVSWARGRGIMIGPGRGSAAGSLVTYAIGITSVDPLQHGLMFERFYRPGRMDLPDIDTDFEDVRRGEVLDYIVQRFGSENVSKIATYAVLKAKGAVKDTCRLLGVSHEEANQATRVIDDTHMSTDEVFAQPSMQALFAKHEGVEGYARALAGVVRGTGEHASGIIVAGDKLSTRGALWRGKEGSLPVICWDMRQAEKMGLMKLDILGLRTLHVLRLANDNLHAAKGQRIDYENLTLDDERVLDLFNRGDTVGCFQFESAGIRKALKEVGVDRFEDIVAVNALYRPGPMELIPVYAQGKRDPSTIWYPHPSLEPHLKSTYGVMVYQEQTMSIAREVAGFDWVMVDKLRKAVGKKLPEEMAKLRQDFIEGCKSTSGLADNVAEGIWSNIERFAGYGFNLSHAACYSVIAYWCGYMKVHHPVEFYAAILSATDDGDQRRSVSDDAARNSVEIVPPDVNGSAASLFLPARTGRRIVSPLSAIKGLGEKAADVIVGTREGLLDRQGLAKGEDRVQARGIVTFDPLTTKKASFASLGDFQSRVYARVVNKKIVENLCACGAMPGEQGDAKLMRELLGDTLQRKIEPPRVLKQEDILPIVAKINQLIDAVAPKAGVPPIRPVVGSKPRLMIVLDRPEWRDRDYGELGHGDGFEILRQLLKSELGLKRPDLYLTSFYRFYKPPLGDDSLDEVSEKILKIEIGNIEPSVILACGSRVVKLFSGGRGINQMHGQLASFGQTPVVCCMSPTQAAIDSSKVADLKSALTDQLGALFSC